MICKRVRVALGQVIVRPSVVFKHSVVSMVIKTSSSKNISDPAVRFVLERNLAEYYQEKKDVKATAHVRGALNTLNN